jgi:hypothetical protein
MDYLLEIEIRDGKPVLSMTDLAALLSGRLLLSWGELDFRIEALLEWTWGQVANRQEAEGHEPDPMPVEGRSSHRLKLLRRYFRVICQAKEDALAEFDKLVGEQKRLEADRSSLAHGLTLGHEKDGEYVVRPWTFSTIENGERTRDAVISEFTFSQMQETRNAIDAVREGFETLVDRYTKPFIYKTVLIAAAKS